MVIPDLVWIITPPVPATVHEEISYNANSRNCLYLFVASFYHLILKCLDWLVNYNQPLSETSQCTFYALKTTHPMAICSSTCPGSTWQSRAQMFARGVSCSVGLHFTTARTGAFKDNYMAIITSKDIIQRVILWILKSIKCEINPSILSSHQTQSWHMIKGGSNNIKG